MRTFTSLPFILLICYHAIFALEENKNFETELKFKIHSVEDLPRIKELENKTISVGPHTYTAQYYVTILSKDTFYDSITKYLAPVSSQHLLLYNFGYLLRYRKTYEQYPDHQMTFVKGQFYAKSPPSPLASSEAVLRRIEICGKSIQKDEKRSEKYRDSIKKRNIFDDKAIQYIMKQFNGTIKSSKNLDTVMATHQTRRFLLIKPPAEQQHSLPSFWLSADEVLSVGVVGSRRVWSSQMMELEMIDDLSGLASEQVSSRLSVMRQLGRRIEDTLNVRAGGGEKYREGVEATIFS